MTPAERDEQRFWANIERDERGCWLWTGAVNAPTPRGNGKHMGGGYARFFYDGKQSYAHRYAYEKWNGPIPEGLQIDHLCRNRKCANPKHLEAVTPKENSRRGAVAFRNGSKETCKRGHEYDEANTYHYVYPDGKNARFCRTCKREWARKYRLKG